MWCSRLAQLRRPLTRTRGRVARALSVRRVLHFPGRSGVAYTHVRTTTKKASDRLTEMIQPLTVPQVVDTLVVPHGTDPPLCVAAHRNGRADSLRRRAHHQEGGLESAQRWTDHPV